MPITDHVRSRSSTLSRFLRSRLPQLDSVEAAWLEELQAASDAEHGPSGRWNDVGRALELRIGLDLAGRPKPEELLGFLPAEQCSELLVAVGFSPKESWLVSGGTTDPLLLDWSRVKPWPYVDQEGELLALVTCLDLTEAEGLAHGHPDWTVDKRRSVFVTATEDGSLGQDPEAIAALSAAWRRYVAHGRAAFCSLGGHVLVSPEIGGGFGVADLVIGDTLVDVKLSKAAVPPVGEWLKQLLGYLLLDWDDVLGLEKLAVYAGWQGQMLSDSVCRILAAASPGVTPALMSLREEFRVDLRSDFSSFIASRRRKREHR